MIANKWFSEINSDDQKKALTTLLIVLPPSRSHIWIRVLVFIFWDFKPSSIALQVEHMFLPPSILVILDMYFTADFCQVAQNPMSLHNVVGSRALKRISRPFLVSFKEKWHWNRQRSWLNEQQRQEFETHNNGHSNSNVLGLGAYEVIVFYNRCGSSRKVLG